MPLERGTARMFAQKQPVVGRVGDGADAFDHLATLRYGRHTSFRSPGKKESLLKLCAVVSRCCLHLGFQPLHSRAVPPFTPKIALSAMMPLSGKAACPVAAPCS